MCETIQLDEFYERVREWRGRYAVNDLALCPVIEKMEWFEDKRCNYNGDGTVTLQCYWSKNCPSSKWER